MRQIGRYCAVGLCGLAVLCAAYCALRSSPRLSEIGWLPTWLSAWADAYGVGRNVLAFGVLGLAAFAGLGTTAVVCFAAAVFAIGLEIAQLWIPGRNFDWKDIVASLGGLAIAWTVVRVASIAARRVRGRDRSSRIEDRMQSTPFTEETGGFEVCEPLVKETPPQLQIAGEIVK